jgi:HK97 gp10 family phage protein
MAWDIHQVSDLANRLGQAGPKAALLSEGAIRRASAKVYREAFAAAPVGLTGDLRASLVNRQEGPLAAVVEATVYYASFVEYGTVRRHPEPYLIPAAQQADGDLTEAITRAGMAGLR